MGFKYKLIKDKKGNYTSGYELWEENMDPETGEIVQVLLTQVPFIKGSWVWEDIPETLAHKAGKLAVEKLILGVPPTVTQNEIDALGFNPSDKMIHRIAEDAAIRFWEEQRVRDIAAVRTNVSKVPDLEATISKIQEGVDETIADISLIFSGGNIRDTKRFSEDNGLVKTWVRLIKRGKATLEDVPTVGNLQGLVEEKLREKG